ncbi:MAG: hypothetical protein JOY90_04340 [Bradyrhizobium sp.]|uniref:hypothetical protein n=1 Tax=Bradyrhizobium sp. TaxID=376 RepID=UPI001DD4D920|nr:hypothetical protein [Bradyrhizobium sp.]MBV9559678.1 hypothetical protein [Bradyrhizobium sp.]
MIRVGWQSGRKHRSSPREGKSVPTIQRSAVEKMVGAALRALAHPTEIISYFVSN